MRLLIITNNPDGASFRQRIGLHLPLLHDRGVRCEVFRIPAGAWSRQRLYARARAFDAVLLHRKMLNPWDAFWLRRSCSRLLFDFDDAIMVSDCGCGRVSWTRLRGFRRTVALSDTVIAGNGYLAEHAQRYGAAAEVLPTGLSLEPYAVAPARGRDGKRRLVWIGSQSTLKYLADLRPVLEEVGRRCRDVVLRIICDAFFDLEHMEVEKIPWSEPTEAADLLASDIGLAPLRDDPFARGKCGFKILQYQAAALPVVASPVGVNAEYVRDGVTGFHATDPAAWVRMLTALLEDAGQRESMGWAGRKAVDAFDRERIGERFYRIICRCVPVDASRPGCQPIGDGAV